jgi:hypothetical protein
MKISSFILALFTATLFFSSCEKEVVEVVPDNGVTIGGIPATASIDAGAKIAFTPTADGLDGLVSASITKDGALLSTVTLTGTSASFPFEYSAVAADAAKKLVFEFTVTDKDGDKAKATHELTVGAEPTTIRITQNITTNTTWVTGKTYILGDRIFVTSGAKLTIQKGVIVKGESEGGPRMASLIITRGAQIDAQGTSTEPIIFTSVEDKIAPGQIESPNMEPTIEGWWGGLIVLGRAKCSILGDVTEVQVDGPTSGTNTLYGGTNDADNSGIIKHISIRHSGALFSPDNGMNGLTLAGVGSGTVIENVEVLATKDDGIKFLGGTVSAKNVLIWNSSGDAIQTDQSWGGTLDNFIIICGTKTNHALEIYGPRGTYNAAHTVKNGSIKGQQASEFGDFRSSARGTFENLYFFNFPAPAASPADSYGGSGGDLFLDASSIANFTASPKILVFNKLEATLKTGVILSMAFKKGTDAFATEVALKANTVGANKAAFLGWTWADRKSALADFK